MRKSVAKRCGKRGLPLLACLFVLAAASGAQSPPPAALLARGRQLAFQVGPRAALPLFQQALPLFRAGRDTRGEALTLGYIGYCYEELSDYPHALDSLNQALALKRGLGDRHEEAKTLNILGLVYWEMSNYPKAVGNFNESLQIARQVHDAQLEGAVLNNLGLVSDDQGTYHHSMELFRQALAIARAAHFARGEGDAIGNLGGHAQLLGQYREALGYYTQARALDERRQIKPNLSEDLVNLGLCRLGLGQPDRAIAYFDQTVTLTRQIGLKGVEADAHKDKGSALLELGRYDAARLEYDQAIRVYEEAGLKQRLVEALNDEGTLLAELGDAVPAEADFRRAIDLARAIGHPRGVTANLLALGGLERRRQRFDSAVSYFQQAIQLAQNSKDQGSMAAALLQLALTLRDENKFYEARPKAEQALAIARGTGAAPVEAQALYALAELDRRGAILPQALDEYLAADAIARKVGDTELEWRAEYGRGQTLESLRRDGEALAAYRQAVEVIEGVRSLLSESRFRAGYLQDKYPVYVSLVRLLLRMGKLDQAYLYSEKLRALSYREIVHQDLPAQFPNGRELLSQIRHLQHALDDPGGDPSSPASRHAGQLILTRLWAAERKYQSALDDLRSRDPGSAAINGLSVASAAQVQARLPARAALVEYLVGDDGVIEFALTHSALHAVTVPVSSAILRAKIELFRDLVASPESNGWRTPAASLESLLIEPIEKPGWLKGVTRLYLVPNSALYYLPFAALPRSAGAGSRFLIEDYELSYLPAAAALAYARPRPPSAGSLLALAPAQSRLRYAQQEAQTVSAFYSPHSLDLQGIAATKAAFLRVAGRFQLIHLATHGFFDTLDPLFSGVQLQPDAGDDGRLEVYEILRLRLRARLVTLSACETGLASGYLNEFPAGDEFVGLTRAFLSAGSSSVLASLWPVDDRSSLLFMQDFYRTLLRADSAAALRNAQLALLHSPGPYSQPYYWAPFVLVGGKK